MTRTLRVRVTFVFACLCIASAGPSTARAGKPAMEPDAGLGQRIDIELREADVQEVLASFGAIFGGETEVDPAIAGEVTIELHHVRAATALTAVCESAGCLWRITDGRLVIERDPEYQPPPPPLTQRAGSASAVRLDEPIDMELEGADLREVLRSFGGITGARVSIADSLQGKVTIELANTPARRALDAVCRVHGCRWELREETAGPVLVFTPAR